MVSQSLVAFDTDHIKGYVFGTSKLKEIRGASSILDHLNRVETVKEATKFGARTIYSNGGSACFVVDSDKADQLGKTVQRLYLEKTAGGASITYAIQSIPPYGTQDIMSFEMPQELELLRWRLREAKNNLREDDSSLTSIAQPSHALLCTCNSCGIAYAEETRRDQDDPDEPEGRYCSVCLRKRDEDITIKTNIPGMIRATREGRFSDETLWGRILESLSQPGASGKPRYNLSSTPDRPSDFNIFRNFTGGKDYLGLIYADVNGMGKALGKLNTLQEEEKFANEVDNAVFEAMGYAISKHLPVENKLFPFDILLVGGDDIVMVTPAVKALPVATTIAERFYELTQKKYTLSVGIVLAPVKFPFSLQKALVDDILKAAKKAGSAGGASEQEQTRIDFVVVTGSTSLNYQKIHQQLHRKKTEFNGEEFYATLRPCTLEQLKDLLKNLEEGNEKRLGRTKLHQLREAILKLNRTTTILEALSVLRNWKEQERAFIKQLVDSFDTRPIPEKRRTGTLFPWYLEGTDTYRTPLLDFIELYDFVSF